MFMIEIATGFAIAMTMGGKGGWIPTFVGMVWGKGGGLVFRV